MPPSVSSRLSSPLSSQSSREDFLSLYEHPTDPGRRWYNGAPIASRRRQGSFQRSPTSSTVGLAEGEGDDESVLSDLSSEGDEEQPVERSREASQRLSAEGEMPTKSGTDSQATTPKEASPEPEQEPSMEEDDNDSDTGSLSPPPPSAEVKSQPLPAVDTGKSGNAGGRDRPLGSDESDLDSLTDSNGDVDAQDMNDEGDNDLPEPESYLDGAEPELEQGEDEDEEGEGDVTLRPDGAGDVEAEEMNGEDGKTEDGVVAAVDAPQESADGEDAHATEAEEAAADQEDMEPETEAEAPPSPALSIQPFRPHTSHPPPPTSAAVKALFGLEIKFAALRDRLYVERMEETAAEEEMILNGTHPAVSYLFKNLKARRERLHEVAARRHKQVLEEISKVKDDSKEAVWTWWTEERDREQWEEFEQTWAKRRRLIREKSELDHIPTKRPKAIPRTLADLPRPLDWAAGAVPAPMSAIDAANDLAMMDIRRHQLSRHASPAIYQQHAGPNYNPYYHPDEPYQQAQYLQRVPAPQPVQHQHQVHRPAQTGYGPAVFAPEPRREGRTVPTSSALFDGGRRSNEGISTSQIPHPQSQPQIPAQAPGPAPSLGADLWGKDSRLGNGYGGHTVLGANANGLGLVNGGGNGNGNGNGNGHVGGNTMNGNGTASSQIEQSAPAPSIATAPTSSVTGTTTEQKPATAQATSTVTSRYPGLADYLTPSAQPTSQTAPTPTNPQSQKIEPVSPVKSSLGITGVPTGLPLA